MHEKSPAFRRGIFHIHLCSNAYPPSLCLNGGIPIWSHSLPQGFQGHVWGVNVYFRGIPLLWSFDGQSTPIHSNPSPNKAWDKLYTRWNPISIPHPDALHPSCRRSYPSSNLAAYLEILKGSFFFIVKRSITRYIPDLEVCRRIV